MSTFHDWAKWWVAAGCAVFPLPPNMKAPAEGGLGIRSASTNPANIDIWWGANPDCNIGIVGDPHATDRFLLRVDVDPKRDGHLRWAELTQQYGAVSTLTVKTPSGGFHYYFLTRQPLGNGTGALPRGIDIRGHSGGYTVGAGSVTIGLPPAQVAGVYELINNTAMADAPEWLISLIQQGKPTGTEPVVVRTEITSEAYQELRSALLSPGMLRDWARWSDNGLALRTLGDAGYALWCEYSAAQLAACPDEPRGDDTAETWWRRHAPGGIKSDYRSIFVRAQALGWKNPKAVYTSTLGFGAQPSWQQSSQWQQQPAQGTNERKFKLISEAEFSNGPPPEWRIDNLLPKQGLGMIYGPSGVGKSHLTLDALACIADGRSYGINSLKVTSGRVVYVLGEGAGGMRQRLRAYRHKYPATNDNFKIINVAPNLMSPADVAEIMQTIMEAGGADVIVFDTMHSCMAGGDENSAKDMGVLLSHARAIAACINGLVMFVHHSGKDESKGARGSSSIKAAMEVQIEVAMNPKFPNRRIASIAKQRDGDDQLIWEFDLEPVVIFGDRPLTSVVLRHLANTVPSGPRLATSDGRRLGNQQELLCDVVKETSDQYPNGIPMEVLIAAVTTQRQDLKTTAIRNTLTKCIEEGLLSIDTETNVRLMWR